MVVEEQEDLNVEQPSPKVDSILDRRRQLKRQRRNRRLQAIWRTGAILSFAMALGWGVNQPEWKIRSLEQVSILGNTHLSAQTLEQLLPLTYPSSLIRVEPQKIAEQLKSYAHVQQAVVSRQLLPPQVTIVVQERMPVAKLQCAGCVLVYDSQTPLPKSNTWLIDSEGVVLPLSSYPAQQDQSLPALEIQGYLSPHPSESLRKHGNPVMVQPAMQTQLRTMLPLLLASPVPIKRVDLTDETNLKLSTALGMVHLSQFEGDAQTLKLQLESLDKLRSLPNRIDLSKVAYLDLGDPNRPTLMLKESPSEAQAIDQVN